MKVMYYFLHIIDPEGPCLNLLLLDHQHMKSEFDVHHMPLTYNWKKKNLKQQSPNSSGETQLENAVGENLKTCPYNFASP